MPAGLFFRIAAAVGPEKKSSDAYNGVKIEDTLRVLALVEEHLSKGDAHSARHVTRGILKDAGIEVGPWHK